MGGVTLIILSLHNKCVKIFFLNFIYLSIIN